MWLLPTRERPHNLRRFFNQAIETNLSTPGRIIIGEADFKKNQLLYADIVDRLPPDLGWKIIVVKATTLGGAVEEVWREHCKDWIGLVSDDSMPITGNWDQKLISKLNRNIHLVSANDNWQAPNRVGSAMVFSREIADKMGWLYPEGITHMFMDDVWEVMGRTTGIWKVEMNVIIEHWHPLNMNMGKMDETYARPNTNKAWANAQNNFNQWRDRQFHLCVQKIETMLKSNA